MGTEFFSIAHDHDIFLDFYGHTHFTDSKKTVIQHNFISMLNWIDYFDLESQTFNIISDLINFFIAPRIVTLVLPLIHVYYCNHPKMWK